MAKDTFVDRREYQLLKRLERSVSAHFITPHLPEHMNEAHATLMDLRKLRSEPPTNSEQSALLATEAGL